MDIASSTVLGLLLGFVFGFALASSGMTPPEIQEMFMTSVEIQIAGIALGLFATGLGGFVAAWMGRGFPVWHAFAMGVASLLWSLLVGAVFADLVSSEYASLGLAFVVPVAMFGGDLRHITIKPKQKAST